MTEHHWVLRWSQPDGSEGIGVLPLPAGTSLMEATDLAFNELQGLGHLLERITCAETGEAGELGFAAANAPEAE